ncbi:GNAT family N-acetyltransferase [Streptomyces sp. ME03-5684b]|uniref:GNAT family N-acetyltransferase n=1 Tax=Streptomyces sp. ME03-5684b TaxID=3028681 RepID=UPI0029A89CA5|nr:GNAT family N-acetyltransferase [Streptomyces sp. ME03-5684b]MDX3322935.1 GNAT family N-acetyltransferase [Streptomyces sp. ME03-5684b]
MKPSARTPEALVITPVTNVTRNTAFEFHRSHLGEFMLPVTSTAFQQIVKARQMVVVERQGEIVGLCYVKPDGKELDTVSRWEFGGLHLSPALRGRGLGTLLSSVAITAVTRADPKPVMGYVHQDNPAGMGLLVHRLGFVVTDQKVRLGPDDAPGHLRRDSAGCATAHVLRLPDAARARLSDDLERIGLDSDSPSVPVTLRSE